VVVFRYRSMAIQGYPFGRASEPPTIRYVDRLWPQISVLGSLLPGGGQQILWPNNNQASMSYSLIKVLDLPAVYTWGHSYR